MTTREEFYNEIEENNMNIPSLSLGRKSDTGSAKITLSAKSARGMDWMVFAAAVLNHIENYTVGQYGDSGQDPASEYTPEDALRSASKYIARFGRNAREGEQSRDFLKLAHYAQLAHTAYGKRNG
jgi:hypothetical protein